MSPIHVRFIINELNNEEVEALQNNEAIITKMILTPDDYGMFHYVAGNSIEVQTHDGYRMWCTIEHLEIVSNAENVILIFTLIQKSNRN